MKNTSNDSSSVAIKTDCTFVYPENQRRKLSQSAREGICDRWRVLLEETDLQHEFSVPPEKSRVMLKHQDGAIEFTDLGNITVVFEFIGDHEVPIDVQCCEYGCPRIFFYVNHAPIKGQNPQFLAAVGKVISDHIGKTVNVTWMHQAENLSALICADADSAWIVADYLLRGDEE
jgi:hypothetical protein